MKDIDNIKDSPRISKILQDYPALEKLGDSNWRLCNLYSIKDPYGKKITFKPNWAQQELLDNLHNCNIVLKARQLGICLDPKTKVLKSDMSWSEIGKLNIGDELVSVDEYPPGPYKGRRLKKGKVQGIIRHIRDCYRITFDNGKTLVCSGKHPWLSRKTNTQWEWRSVVGEGKKHLNVGDKIRRIVPDTWDTGGYEDGWISGMLDGEGSLAKNKRLGGNISISQVDGKVFDRAINYFKVKGYSYRIEIDKGERTSKFGKKPVNKIVLSRIDEIFRLIGETRPSRFLNSDWWEGKELPILKGYGYSTIIKIDNIGDQEVVDLQTSAGTYIAEGYVSHNTTLFCIYLLDQVLWNDNVQAGIIAHTLDDAQNIFVDKLKFAFDNLHPALRALFRTVGDSAKELSFTHGSVIRVGTSLRSSTLQFLHVSEFGKICAKYPEKAREVITGALNTIHPGQFVIIESTAEGREGAYFELCDEAFRKERMKEKFGSMDFHPFFFPWWKHPSYILDEPQDMNIEQTSYFDNLDNIGITLNDQQKWWYVKKQSIQGDDMLREFPSTQEEAFLASQVGNWYATQIKELYAKGHITTISYDKSKPVNTAWDLGQSDAMVIWFFQINRAGEIMVIDYFQKSDCPLDEVAQILNAKGYTYGTHIWPHDARARDRAGITFEMQAHNFNLTGMVLEKHGLLDGINIVRTTLSKMWFDEKKCAEGINALSNYKKKWNTQIGGFTSVPLHDSASNGSDAMRYLCAGYTKLTDSGTIESDFAAIRSYWGS